MWLPLFRTRRIRWSALRPLSTHHGQAGPPGPRNSLRRRPLPQPASGRRREAPRSARPESSDTQHSVQPGHRLVENSLVTAVHVPEDPNAVLRENHPSAGILANSALIVQRKLELMNVMIGFEEANKYVILDGHGNHIGYMAEQDRGLSSMLARQWFRTHRSFVTHVFDRHENEVLRFHRPFAWISSRIRVYDPVHAVGSGRASPAALQATSRCSLVQATGGSNARLSPFSLDEMRVVGEAHQVWAPLRRKYDLFQYHHPPNVASDALTEHISLPQSDFSRSQQRQLRQSSHQRDSTGEFVQFAYVDEPFLAWDFSLLSADNKLIGSVSRNFSGFAREAFTDTGVYALSMDSASASLPSPASASQDGLATSMTLDQRAIMLATAVSIDFDYFSRHSRHGGFGFIPLSFPGAGGEVAAGSTPSGGAAAPGEAGALGESAPGAIGRPAAPSGTIGENANSGAAGLGIGAGAMAGYDALQRGIYGASSSQPDSLGQRQQQQQQQQASTEHAPSEEDLWSSESQVDAWDRGSSDPWSSGESEDTEDGGDDADWF